MLKIIIALIVTSGISIILTLFYILYRLKSIIKKNIDATVPTSNSNEPLDLKTLNGDLEPFGFAYTEEQDNFFSLMYPWQREYGYGWQYDKAAPLLSMIIDCEPIIFEYNNKLWLIEFWKGQYGMTTGAEIGIYTSNEKNKLFGSIIFDSATDEERLPMSYTLTKNNTPILIRSGVHWWLTGFKLGVFSDPSELAMDITITLDNQEMCDAFVSALEEAGYQDKDIQVMYNSVRLTYDKPHAKQPRTRRALMKYIMQKYNEHNCELYNSFTKDYDTTIDKLNFIKRELPFMYMQIMNIGGTKHLFANNNKHKKS